MENPLLEDHAYPAFSRIEPEHVEPAIDALIADGRRLIAALTENTDAASWDRFVQPIEEEDDRLARAWSPVIPSELGHEFGCVASRLQCLSAEAERVRHRGGAQRSALSRLSEASRRG